MSAYDLRPVDLLDPAQEDAAREWLGVHSDFQREVFGDRGSAWTFEEMLGMCVYMGGGPALMYAAHALDAFVEYGGAPT